MLFLPRRGKITPANIRMKYRRRRLKAAQHHEALAAAEHLHDAAVDNDLSAPATPLPPAGEAEAPPPPAAGPSPPAPRPPPNRALHFDTQAHLPAVEPSRAPEPSPPPVDDPRSPPDSTPGQGGSVLRMVEVQEKVHAWQQRCGVAGAPLDRYPTPPGAPQDDGLSSYSDSMCEGGVRYTANYKGPRPSAQSKPLTVHHRGQFWVRKDHTNPEGNAPLCYVKTGYDGPPTPDGDHHQVYLCYNKSDIQWAKRLKFHINLLV